MTKGARRQPRTARWQRASALLPLVLLSGALSANAAGDRDSLDATAATTEPGAPAVPATAFDQPASVALPGQGAMSGLTAGLAPESDFSFPRGDAPSSYRQSMSVNGIPASALTAYRRAEAILDQADPGCNLDWTLVAAIGRVESDHGRYGGNVLDSEGKAQPGIYGVPLDGSNGTARIVDTDNGAYDNDTVYDRAVGPMQFIPGTWAVAGVDADQDGKKDPQDIDDAATATAVYLCAGSDDLSTDAGQRSAVYRYNHSNDYVELVLSIAASYAGGDFAAVPNGTPSSTTLTSEDFAADGRPATGTRNQPSGGTAGGSTAGGTASSGSVSGSDDDDGSGGGSTSDGTGGDGSTGGDGGNGGGDGYDGDDGDEDTNDPVAPAPDDSDPVGDAVDGVRDTVRDTTGRVGGGGGDGGSGGGGSGGGGGGTVEDTLSPLEEAQNYCSGLSLGAVSMSQCVNAYLNGGASAVQALLDPLG